MRSTRSFVFNVELEIKWIRNAVALSAGILLANPF